jgi:hypothetical protein
MNLFHRKKKPKLNAFVCMLFCPKFDMNCLHVINSYHNISICAGCGELIEGSEEIALRDKTAQRHKENRFKIWAEERDK